MNGKCCIEASGAPKNDFHKNSTDHQFFRLACANFVRIFGPDKTYKPKNPSGWHYLLEKSSPEMDSNRNSNVWNRI